jgi:HD-GYP domain-containing protein (c-di-GMP phosphodiesterase class II)
LIAAGMTADFQKCLDTGQPINVEHPYTSKWGKSIHVHIQCMPVFSEKKDVERIQVILEDVTERKQAEATVRQRLSELEFLYQSGLGLGQILEPEEVAQKIIDQMEKQLHWHHCAIRLYDADSQSLKVIGVSAPGLENEIDRQGLEEHFDSLIQTVGEGLTGKAVELGQTLRINDLKSDPHYVESFPGLNSGLYVPIQLNNRVIGVITVENEQQGAFSLSDERLVDILANQVAIALENSRLHRETLQQLKQLRSLRSIDLAITSSLDLNVTLDILIHQAMQQLIVDAIAVFLLQPDINSLKHASSQGFQTNLLEDLKWVSLADDSLLGLAVMERHILNSQCVQEPHIHLRRIWKNEGFYSMISIPLLSKGELKGVMGIFFRAEGNNPTKPQMDFIETLAGQAAIAIENVQLFDGLHKTNMELAIAYDATIEGWSRAMDLRDKETEGHTKRVVEMTMKMASYFGFAGEALMQIRRGALLHDIGKLGVPDRILLKPDKLTEDEWAIMRKHPAFAFEMLSPIHYLNQAISIPYCHHEKWDGTGYPRGLSGERIPLEARIFAVVDVWDALTSDRPYRKAWSREEVIEYIRSLSGSHFDPQVVDRFMLEISHENK